MSALVSILIPCRDGGRFLAETLDSAIAQSHPNTEIIVVDDGSTDDSRAIAESRGPRVTVLANPGRGASAARNHATAHARGEFLQYLDADDLLTPDAIALRLDVLLAGQGADLAVSDWRRLRPLPDHTWAPGAEESGQPPHPEWPADLVVFRGFWAPPAALLYRRSLVARMPPWPDNLPVIQDARFLFEAARAGARIVHTPGVGALYREHAAGSLSTANRLRFWRDVFENARQVETIWRADPSAPKSWLSPEHRAAVRDAHGLVARMGFIHDQALFESALVELRRFPDWRPSRFVRVAMLLHRLLGYGIARRLLARACPPSA